MHVDQLKPGTYFEFSQTAFLYNQACHIVRCWDGALADAGFHACPHTQVNVISLERARELVRRTLDYARLA